MTTADEARKALEGVTPGPWVADTPDEGGRAFVNSGRFKVAVTFDDASSANTNFIAWCREGVPAMLAEIAAKDAEIARLREALDRACAAAVDDIAAAQSDYDASIRSALTAVPSPDVAGLVEAALRDADMVSDAIVSGKRIPRGQTEDLRNHIRKLCAALACVKGGEG